MVANGLGTTFVELSGSGLGTLRVPLPPVLEQRQIADFLDRETAEIDAFIADQDRLIKLLSERRSALAASLFLPGDSTISGRLMRLLTDRPTYGVLVPEYVDADDGVSFVRVGDLDRLAENETLPKISQGQSCEYSRTVLNGGEVLLGVVGKMGKSVVAPKWLSGGNVARAVAVFRCQYPQDASVLNLWFSTSHFLSQAESATSGDSVQPTLGMKEVASFVVNWPADHGVSQTVIANCTQLEVTIAEARRAIDLSRERRAALITAAVTGQLGVRAGRPKTVRGTCEAGLTTNQRGHHD